jgi:hypothetical protein
MHADSRSAHSLKNLERRKKQFQVQLRTRRRNSKELVDTSLFYMREIERMLLMHCGQRLGLCEGLLFFFFEIVLVVRFHYFKRTWLCIESKVIAVSCIGKIIISYLFKFNLSVLHSKQ